MDADHSTRVRTTNKVGLTDCVCRIIIFKSPQTTTANICNTNLMISKNKFL